MTAEAGTLAADVLVLGGGLTGLACARLLHDQSAGAGRALSIMVLDAGPAPAPCAADLPLGLRVIALSPASQSILAACHAWPAEPAGRIGECRRMLVWRGEAGPVDGQSIRFDAAEFGRPALMAVVENDLVRAMLWQSCAAAPGIRLESQARAAAVAVGPPAVEITLADGRSVRAALVIGAEGHDSWLRQALGVQVTAHGYGQSALVAHVAGERPHGDTAWQRFLPDGPLALLPLADGRSSIVWSTARADALLAAGEADFNAALADASGGVRGALALTTPRHAVPLAASHAGQYTGLRWALIGDAAHRVHPLAGQGANLGLADAAALAEAIAQHLRAPHADPGDPLALRRYERWRKAANLTTLAAMDAFHDVFTSRAAGIAAGAGRALGLVDRLGPVKQLLAGHAMGLTGDLPRVART